LERRLAAILAADVVGYSRLMGEDEAGTLERLKSLRRELVQPKIIEHKGRIVKLMGDGLLAEFPSVVEAVQCAIDIQQEVAEREPDISDSRRIWLRIGINLGDIIVEGSDIYGDGVNVAARLEALAEPGGIFVSGTVFDSVKGKVDVDFSDLGEQRVKNIKEPIRAYQVRLKSSETSEAAASDRPDLDLPDEPSIAVLPFTNMSGDPEQEYFSDGIAEDIITALSRIPRLFVVARHSTSAYKGQAVDIKQVGREQGVQFVLEGSVRKSGNRIRITAQLIDASTGNHRWADRYDRDLIDIFAVQDEITRNVTIAVQVELTAGEQARLWAGGTDNIEAWECVVRGNEYVHRHAHEDNQEARRLADRALSLDPDYANAWVLYGLVYYEEAMWGWGSSREASLSTAEEAANRAIELEEFSPDGFSLLAIVKSEQAEFDEAVEIGRKAVSLSPRHAPNLALYTVALGRAGNYQAALQQIKRAIRLSPIYPAWYLHVLGSCGFAVGEDEQAVSAYRTCLEATDPDSAFVPIVRVWLAICLANAGHGAEARTVSAEVLRLDPSFRIDDWWQFPRKDWALRERAVGIWNEIVSS
jgi:adenylate cyclase